MAEFVIMPKLGFNMSEGKIVKWYKQEGESVKKGEALFSVETDKTNIDIDATGDGVVRKLLLGEGDKLAVTLPIAIIGSADENIDNLLAEAEAQLGTKVGDVKAMAAEKVDAAAEKPASADKPTKQAGAYDFDVAVLGGGPGGYVAAIKAAQSGKKAAIIEKENFGGTCLNVGCIPTKALLKSVEALKEVKLAGEFGVDGVDASNAKLNMASVQARKSSITSMLVGGVERLLGDNGVEIIREMGEIKDRHKIQTGNKFITAENIIIATGSDVKTLPINISPEMEVLTSKEMLDIEEIPESVAVIGGGVIGIEFAYFLAAAGSKVTVIEFLDRILPMVDEEITQQVADMLSGMGIEIHTGARVSEITGDSVVFEKGGSRVEVKTHKVLMAVGRTPSLSGISCEDLGIKTEKGAIVTDERLRTSVDNIYAIGDVNGKMMLAHTASMEGIIAVKNICGEDATMDYDKIPSAIYLSPEVASVGLTEEQAINKYGKVKVGKFPMFANGKAMVGGENRGIIKVITEPRYREIVGVHIYCANATEMIAEAVTAMKLEGTAEEMASVVHPHPTISEALMEAFLAADDRAIHWM